MQKIYIQCEHNCFSLNPIKALFQALSFAPKDPNVLYGLTVFYPLDPSYREHTQNISFMETVTSAQFLGFVSTWRVIRRFHVVAKELSSYLKNTQVIFESAKYIDPATRLFLGVLEKYLPQGSIQLQYGQPSPTAISYQPTPDELLVEKLLCVARDDQELFKNFSWLKRMGRSAVLSTNFWLARGIYEKLFSFSPLYEFSYNLGVIARFFEQPERSGCYYTYSLQAKDVMTRANSYYGLAILHLRFYPVYLQSPSKAAEYLEKAHRELLSCNEKNENTLFFAFKRNRAAYALVLYRQRNYSKALSVMQDGVKRLLLAPVSDERQFYLTVAKNNIATLHKAMGRIDEAIEQMRAVVAIDPYMPLWWSELAKYLMLAHRYEEAYQTLHKVIAYDWLTKDLYLQLAKCAEKLGKHDEAAQMRKKAAFFDD